jgi:hypothetical protein
MEPRLASSVLVGALVRQAEAEGGFAAVVAKGDATAGAILLVLTERGAKTEVYERVLESGGGYSWRGAGPHPSENSAEVPEFVARRRRFDPDLWVVELDIPSIERFAAEMNALG